MAFERAVDLYLNTTRQRGLVLLRRKNDGGTPADPPQWVQGDKFLLRLWFLTPSETTGVAPAVESVPAGSTIKLAGKTDPDDETFLFLVSAFTEVGAGNTLHYEAELDLNTTELESALAGATDQTSVLVDVEVRDGANDERITFQFPVVVIEQVYRGDEADPTPATPPYPAADDILVSATDGTNLKFGSVLFDQDEQSKAVAFTTAFAAPPRSIRLTLEVPDGDSAMPTVAFHSRTAAGFTILLSVPTPAAGYRVHWEALR